MQALPMLTAYGTDSLKNPFVKEAFSLNDFWDMNFLSVTDYFITEKRLCQESISCKDKTLFLRNTSQVIAL